MKFEGTINQLTDRAETVIMIAQSGGDELFLSRLLECLEAGEDFALIVDQEDRQTRWRTVEPENDEDG